MSCGPKTRRPARLPVVTAFIIAVNILVFLLELTRGDKFVMQWSAIPAQIISGHHWRMPVIVKEAKEELLAGPVLVTIEYSIIAEQESQFLKAMRQYSRVRSRDCAYQWGIYRDIEANNRFVEIFLVHSWAEHLRQHERQTNADRALEDQVYSYVAGEPKVRHLLYADSISP